MKAQSRYEAIIWQIVQHFRKDLNFQSSMKVAMLLLCWAKLTADGRLRSDLCLSDDSRPKSADELAQLFQQISAELGSHPNIFEIDGRLISRISTHTAWVAVQMVVDAALHQAGTDFQALFFAVLNSFESEGQKEPVEMLLPTGLSRLMIQLAGIQNGESVYCLNGAATTPAILAGTEAHAIDIRSELKAVENTLPLAANILCNLEIRLQYGDAIQSPAWVAGGELLQFTCALAAPPFQVRYKYPIEFDQYMRFPEKPLTTEVLEIRHCLAHSESKVIALVPMSVLTRTTGGEKDFRNSILSNRLLKAVIGLPSGVLLNTNIQSAILVLDKSNKSDEVIFLDLTQESEFVIPSKRGSRATFENIEKLVDIVKEKRNTPLSCVLKATSEMIAANEYSLDPSRYALSGDVQSFRTFMASQNLVPLKQICEIVRCQVVEDPNRPVTQHFYEIAVGDIESSGLIGNPKKIVNASDVTSKTAEKQRLFPGDILLSVKGSVGQIGLVTDSVGPNWIANQSFVILRAHDIIPPEVLFRYLRSDVGQQCIKLAAGGASLPLLSTKAVEQLDIIVPTALELNEIKQLHAKALALHYQANKLLTEAVVLERSKWSFPQLSDTASLDMVSR